MLNKNIVRLILLSISTMAANSAFSQILKGEVDYWDEPMKMEMPLIGANAYWLNTNIAATTNEDGEFKIQLPDTLPAKLIISFVGYQSDTLLIKNASFKAVRLSKSVELKEVNVESHLGTTSVSTINPINVEKLNEGEILKAACCNLSEAFETSPTINVSYKDAVTGAKEIQLLGLSGTYSQLLTENIPNMRGLAGIYGLTFIPAPWLESIQVTKGSGSVANGFESTTGQLNVEFKKPQDKTTPHYYFNLFGEGNGNTEINTFYKEKINNKWSSIFMLHGNYMNNTIDRNHDGFLDVPHSKEINLYNRWQYSSGKHLESQIGFKFLVDQRHGGQVHPGADSDADPYKYYITDILNKRIEAFTKVGIVFPEKPYQSIGNIVQVTYHDLSANVGPKYYGGIERTLYYQSIYQSIIGTTDHQYKVGIGYQYDGLNDRYNSLASVHQQSIPGAFGEYTYSYLEKLKVIAGAREDYHNNYGWIFTPRLHGKYNFTDNFIMRWSAGRSFRVPYPVADNISVLASSKQLLFDEEIKPEQAWNYGINLTRRWDAAIGEGSLSMDLYRTDFSNQLIVDPYSDPAAIHFYNLKGKSFSNSLQVTLNQELIKRLNVRLAYKIDDVEADYNGILKQKPLVAKDRALFNIGYETRKQSWRFDYTLVWEGRKPLVNTIADATYGPIPSQSPDFFTMNTQVTKVWRRFEIYAGVENLLDYRQQHPIINAGQPFSNSFDATQIWGPIEGRRIYGGVRFSIK